VTSPTSWLTEPTGNLDRPRGEEDSDEEQSCTDAFKYQVRSGQLLDMSLNPAICGYTVGAFFLYGLLPPTTFLGQRPS